jgi:hypothetical protein
MTHKDLEHLFELHLDYKEGKPPLSTDGKVGKLIGSGEGRVERPKIEGKVHWTLYEAQSNIFCAPTLFGVITTEDDAKIKFDSMGFVPSLIPPCKHQRVGLSMFKLHYPYYLLS